MPPLELGMPYTLVADESSSVLGLVARPIMRSAPFIIVATVGQELGPLAVGVSVGGIEGA